jgi:hypothetical protein
MLDPAGHRCAFSWGPSRPRLAATSSGSPPRHLPSPSSPGGPDPWGPLA